MKKKSVLFYNKKGGQGKTTHAVIWANYSKSDFYTNDIGNFTVQIYSELLKNQNQICKELAAGEEMEIDDEKPNVFDFGGFLDSRIIEVAKFVDYCVVPISIQSTADLAPSLASIANLEKYNKNIILLINNTHKDYLEYLSASLKKEFKYPIFIINKSNYITKLADEKKTVFDISKIKGINKIWLWPLINKFKAFYSYLEQ